MITDTMEAKLYAKRIRQARRPLCRGHAHAQGPKGFFVQADDPEYLRVMQYLWDITELRGEHAALYDKWLK